MTTQLNMFFFCVAVEHFKFGHEYFHWVGASKTFGSQTHGDGSLKTYHCHRGINIHSPAILGFFRIPFGCRLVLIQPAPFFVVLKNCWGMSAHPFLGGEIPVNIGCLAFFL